VKRLECRHECMSEISADMVMSAVYLLLEKMRRQSLPGDEQKAATVPCNSTANAPLMQCQN